MKKTKKSTIFARQNKIMMNPEKIAQLKEKALSEAERYYNNAKTMLSEKASKQGDYYSDAKYVKTACGTAYCGVLILLDAFINQEANIEALLGALYLASLCKKHVQLVSPPAKEESNIDYWSITNDRYFPILVDEVPDNLFS